MTVAVIGIAITYNMWAEIRQNCCSSALKACLSH